LLSQGRQILVAAELVAQADTDRVELSFRINTPSIEEGVVRMPVIVKLRVAILDAGSEVVSEGIFRADAKRPTLVRIIEAGSGCCIR
jgi:hypothetical protein